MLFQMAEIEPNCGQIFDIMVYPRSLIIIDFVKSNSPV